MLYLPPPLGSSPLRPYIIRPITGEFGFFVNLSDSNNFLVNPSSYRKWVYLELTEFRFALWIFSSLCLTVTISVSVFHLPSPSLLCQPPPPSQHPAPTSFRFSLPCFSILYHAPGFISALNIFIFNSLFIGGTHLLISFSFEHYLFKKYFS